MIGEERSSENSAVITIEEEDRTLATVMRRLTETGWEATQAGVLWWTLDSDATWLTLAKYNETAIELNTIITFDPDKRKKGSGGKVLRALLAVLDELGIGCYLRAVPPKEWGPLCRFRPLPKHGLAKRSLKAWYKRQGFTPVPIHHRTDVMYRAPSSVSPIQSSDSAVSLGMAL